MQPHTARETAPLLGQTAPAEPHVAQDEPSPMREDVSAGNSRLPVAIAVIFAICFVADIGGSLIGTPEVRLLEMAVCRDYYRDHDPTVIGEPPLSYVDESLCKLGEIQTKLAYLRATKAIIMTIPGYFHQTLSTNMILLAPLLQVIGGGNRVLIATMNSIVVDASAPNMRTAIFYTIGAGLLITETIMVPVGSWLLSKDLWLPFKVSAPILVSSSVLVAALPETHVPQKNPPVSECSFPENDLDRPPKDKPSFLTSLRTKTSTHIAQAFEGLKGPEKGAKICLSILFMSTFARQSSHLFAQYASKVLHWPIATTGYVTSVKSMVSLVLLLVLSAISGFFGRQTTGSTMRLNKTVILFSLAALSLGAVLLGSTRDAVTLIIGSIFDSTGYGISQALQGSLASFSDPSSTGELFAGAALIELLAGLSGNFAFAGLFDLGLKMKGSGGIGLPYFVAAALYIVAILNSLAL